MLANTVKLPEILQARLASGPMLLAGTLAASAFVVLAFEPMLWLANSWFTRDYDSSGVLVFAVVCALFLRSLTSPLAEHCTANADLRKQWWPLLLLLASFAVRLASQLLAINVLGALMLAIDVYALGLLLQLGERKRAVDPLWVALLFCFALPLEPLLQRTLGYGLQQLSAFTACGLLSAIHVNAGCEGVRLFIDDIDVLVDLPCSGARLLILMLTGFLVLAAAKPLNWRQGMMGGCFTLVLALLGNTLRIVVLAWGIRYSEITGLNIMLDPWHSLTGLVIAAAALGLVWHWVSKQESVTQRYKLQPRKTQRAIAGSPPNGSHPTIGLPISVAAALLVGSLWVVSLGAKPLDVSSSVALPELPLSLVGSARTALPLTPQEKHYFASYGGNATRAGYAEHSLLLVTTTSPLRHLHTPDICFGAAGYEVTYTGVDYTGVPAAVYQMRSPHGFDFVVQARFISASGVTAHSVSEVVWHWFSNPGEAWTMVQTVSPAFDNNAGAENSQHNSHDESYSFSRAVERALNLTSSSG